MARLSVKDVQNFKIMLHELKEAFLKKFWFLHLLRVHNLTIMSSTCLKSRSPSQDFQDSQALQPHLGSSM